MFSEALTGSFQFIYRVSLLVPDYQIMLMAVHCLQFCYGYEVADGAPQAICDSKCIRHAAAVLPRCANHLVTPLVDPGQTVCRDPGGGCSGVRIAVCCWLTGHRLPTQLITQLGDFVFCGSQGCLQDLDHAVLYTHHVC